MGAGRNSSFRTQETGLNSYAPPKGAHTGVADYAETLRAAMAPFGPLPTPLYHLGNNRLHTEIYARALAEPGVVVLHDAVLHHFLLGNLPREKYVEEFVYCYGEWRRDLAEELWNERGASGVDPRYFELPMLRRAMERARAVIVHNPGAARMARAEGACAVHVIPHFFEAAAMPDAADVAQFRTRIGVGQGTVLFGVLGYLRETKRVLASIRTFKKLNEARPDTALLLAGEIVSRDLARLLESEGTHPAIRRLPRLSDHDFLIAGASIDCCLNLRYPGAGETSGIAIRMMGMGKPVIVTEGAEYDEIPVTACLRVSSGVAEKAELFDHMVMAVTLPRIAKEIGDRARRHIRGNHSLESVALKYWQVLCAAAS